MGLLDKIKNAFFEVEYVEVDESAKKEEKDLKEEKKPIAKKIVLPGKRGEKVEELQEEELRNDHFEIRPSDEIIKEKPKEEFKLMDDNDFRVEDDIEEFEEPKIVRVIGKEDTQYQNVKIENTYDDYHAEMVDSSKQSKLYGIDNSYDIDMHPYGTYEKREEKSFFRPSPIISPIYGILDKNYKKEDVKERREVSISSYTSSHISVDDVRKKAYGEKKDEQLEEDNSNKFEVEEENVLVDLSDRAKPEVKELTMGDAIEYFQDLGLEYNVDYVDVSKGKHSSEKKIEPKNENVEEKDDSSKKKTRSESNVDTLEQDNDNLFDLIDSMYEEKD